jgi:hypothetical protein
MDHMIVICPVCGLPAIDTEGLPPGTAKCTPARCSAWHTVMVYDHERREWLRTDDDGYVLDGRRIEEIP